jgi:hypothetical protein
VFAVVDMVEWLRRKVLLASASRAGRFTVRRKSPCTDWTGGLVGPRACLGALEQKRILSRSSIPWPGALATDLGVTGPQLGRAPIPSSSTPSLIILALGRQHSMTSSASTSTPRLRPPLNSRGRPGSGLLPGVREEMRHGRRVFCRKARAAVDPGDFSLAHHFALLIL